MSTLIMLESMICCTLMEFIGFGSLAFVAELVVPVASDVSLVDKITWLVLATFVLDEESLVASPISTIFGNTK